VYVLCNVYAVVSDAMPELYDRAGTTAATFHGRAAWRDGRADL